MTDYLKTGHGGRPTGIDRKGRVLLGYVIAQEGPFKTPGRGEFDVDSLQSVVDLAKQKPQGLKSRFTHPDLSNDGLGKFLGRARDVRMSHTVNADGETVKAVRGNLYFADSASNTPSGDLAGYVMDLATEDPDALSSSLVLQADEVYRLDNKGKPARDVEGELLPPIWRPTALHASDIVDTGEAVDGLLGRQLSADGLPDEVVRQAAALLKQQFSGRDRAFVEARLSAWVAKVLDHYWPQLDRPEDIRLRNWIDES